MPITQKYKKFALRNGDYELPEYREPGMPVRKLGQVHIDRSCFKKSPAEKEILKLAKLEAKLEAMKKRPV